MTREAKVRVRLDTSKAREDLRDLAKDAAGAAHGISGGMSSGIGGAIGRGGSAAGGIASGLVHQAMGGVMAPTQQGIGDIMGEFTGLIGREAAMGLLGTMPAGARASARAREDLVRVFGLTYGMTGRLPDGAEGYFRAMRDNLYIYEEKGRQAIEADRRFSPEVAAALVQVGEWIGNGVDRIMEAVGGHMDPRWYTSPR